jgi:hypothetical protein
LNLAENHQPVNELYQTADHPTLSPRICHPEWRVKTAGELGSPRGKPAENTCHLTWQVGEGDACMRFGLAHFLNGYSFLMISPNLLDFWAMFFFILSRCGTLHLLIVVRT